MKRILTGKVVSDKMEKTVIVAVERITKHQKYGKMMKKTHTHAAHNDSLVLKVGDRVKIMDVPPISATKHFTVIEKLEK